MSKYITGVYNNKDKSKKCNIVVKKQDSKQYYPEQLNFYKRQNYITYGCVNI